MQTEHKHYFARIPTIFLLVLLGTIPWLAVLLFILRAIDKDAEKREQRAFDANRRYAADFRPEDTRPGAARQAGPGVPYRHRAPYQAPSRPHAPHPNSNNPRPPPPPPNPGGCGLWGAPPPPMATTGMRTARQTACSPA